MELGQALRCTGQHCRCIHHAQLLSLKHMQESTLRSAAGHAAMLKKHILGLRNYPRREMPIRSRLGKHAGLSQKSSCYKQLSGHLRTAM